jgi:hypothetical protein
MFRMKGTEGCKNFFGRLVGEAFSAKESIGTSEGARPS